MKLYKILMLSALGLPLAIAGCNDDGVVEAADGTETGDGGGDGTEVGDGDGDGGHDGDGDGDGDDGGDGDGDSGDPFLFADNDPGDYVRVDRAGMPAVNFALITSQDAYNAADPIDDVNGMFTGEIGTNVQAFHAALDVALADLGLQPCGVGQCTTQVQSLILADTLKLNLTSEAGFPNGRRLDDSVMDMTLALILLNLGLDSQDMMTLVGTNPMANDVELVDTFPFLAEPHPEGGN